MLHPSIPSITTGGLAEPLASNLQQMNTALAAYAAKLKALRLWKSMVLVKKSKFGWHLPSNANMRTAHGWAGNYFSMGGGLNGGRVMGKFPRSLFPNGPQRGHAGRLVPSTPWDAVWNSATQ